MRVFVSMFMVLALVMATSLPTVSHAMMSHDSWDVEKTEASEHDDCHKIKQSDSAQKTAQNDNDHGKCCDMGMCKCVGGTCHNGLSKIFGNGSDALFRLTANTGSFNFTNDVLESTISDRLKRPPKA